MAENTSVNVKLPDDTYRRLKQWADRRRQGVGEAIAELLDDTLPTINLPFGDILLEDAEFEREKEAYLALYPSLRRDYYSRYIAIHDARLVDHDESLGALVERLEDRFPDRFVWISQIGEEAIPSIRYN